MGQLEPSPLPNPAQVQAAADDEQSMTVERIQYLKNKALDAKAVTVVELCDRALNGESRALNAVKKIDRFWRTGR